MAGPGKKGKGKGKGAADNRDAGRQQAAYDGPGSDVRSTSRGRAPSNVPTAQSSRASSRARSQVRPGSQKKDDDKPEFSRNVDFGGNAYTIFEKVSQQVFLFVAISRPARRKGDAGKG